VNKQLNFRPRYANTEELIMARIPRHNHSLNFKAQVALAVVKGKRKVAELSQQFDIHPSQFPQWKT
jgi:transposase-like protein